MVYKEIVHFDLLRALKQGLFRLHYLTSHPKRRLRTYVADYLKEEIQREILVRNLPAFTRFIHLTGFSNGQRLNYANVARDCAIDAKAVKEYFHVLEDTLLGYFIYPFLKS